MVFPGPVSRLLALGVVVACTIGGLSTAVAVEGPATDATGSSGSSGQAGEAPGAAEVPGWTAGMDVSYWQGEAETIDWSEAVERGARFTYIKASEGSYGGTSDRYVAQRKAAAAHGLYTGAYHFANPSAHYASGATQARLFAEYSVAWNAPFADLPLAGEKLLPPMVDLEWNPYPEDGNACYDRTPAEMVDWIHDFVDTATLLFGRPPVIYTNTSWWRLCTGDSAEFTESPLSLADWSTDKQGGPGVLPAGWSTWTFWQHGDAALDYTPAESLLPGDQQYFNGSLAELGRFASTPSEAHHSTREISTPAR
ncbi:MAG: hydrolase [Herbiconiux sp.]|uniref:GH25 family lysozyme n=1 Tax=Herbiconiux sp. TaxID=1871186 RepID=UPI0012094ED8|nr:GH25 family lysozyme [Herbiconiux sp.]TAJ49174.1 MAG: hydrolase [Herbiconiux sp.]